MSYASQRGEMDPSEKRPAALPIRTLLFLTVLVVFGRLLFAEFSWYDDPMLVHHNPALNPPTLQKLAVYWTRLEPGPMVGYYVPLTYMVWGALAKLSYLQQADDYGIHLNPWVFHSANVVLHAASVVIVFSILRLLVRKDWAAGVGAMIFAIHPVQVQAVGWVSGLKDVLSGFLALVAVWQYFAGTRRGYIVATIAMFAATLAKPSAMITPLIVLSIDVLVMKRTLRDSLRALWPWFALALPAAICAKLAQSPAGVPVAPVWARPLVAMDSLTFYVRKLLVPVGLTVDYGRTPVRVFHEPWFYFAWVVPLVVLGICMLSRKRWQEYLGASAIFVAGVLPVLGFTPFLYQKISGVADHYIYLSMLGPALAAAVFVADHPNRAVAAISAIVLVTLAALTVRQTGFWHDDALLFAHNVAINPESGLAHLNLGAALERGGEFDGAEREYRAALRIDPNDADAAANLSDLLRRRGKV